MLKEILEAAKKITLKKLPKVIKGGKLGDLEFYDYSKTRGSYEYTQIEDTPDGDGDYDDGEYNQGLTLDCEIEIIDNQIHLKTRVLDLGRKIERAFAEKYSGLTFDDIDTFTKQLEKIMKEFDKL